MMNESNPLSMQTRLNIFQSSSASHTDGTEQLSSPYLTGMREEGRGFELLHKPIFNETYRGDGSEEYYDQGMPPTFMNTKKASSIYH
jgi:hypothetical protein